MQSLHNTFIQCGAFGRSKFRIKFEYVFSAPECPLVCTEERYEKLKVSYLKGSRVL